jgi:hypothetical protein
MQNLSHLTFGAEFEVILPASLASHSNAAREIARLSGLEVIPAARVGRADRDSQAFRVVHDGSVHGAGLSAEFVSPVLRGQEGLDKITKFAQTLAAIGATVNQSCGFHVHVGGFRAQLPFFKNLVKLYSKFEVAIDTVMPASRRGNVQNYCKSIARVSPQAIDAATSIDGIILAATGHRSSDYSARFYKLNLAAFSKHTTVEFRQHAGTVDAAKAVAWIKTCLRIVAAAEQGKSGHVTATGDFRALPIKAKTVAELITRPQGATRAEVLQVLSAVDPIYRTISVRRQAQIAGLTLRAERARGERHERFFASVNGAATVEVPATLSGLFALISAPAEEASFFATRAAQLAAA